MKTLFAGVAALTLALAAPAFAHTTVSIGVNLGNAPPPPVVVYREQPDWVYVPRERVYVVDDDDLGYDYFRCGGSFYIYRAGFWYRSRSWRGPFIAIEARTVPTTIFAMSDREYRWRHRPEWVPPGIARKMDRDDAPPGWSHGKAKWKDRGDRDEDQGHGHGHGHDRD